LSLNTCGRRSPIVQEIGFHRSLPLTLMPRRSSLAPPRDCRVAAEIGPAASELHTARGVYRVSQTSYANLCADDTGRSGVWMPMRA
jgi:hypothetical protein